MNFDLCSTPIERGTTLIEASAGTGKTFTIAGVVLRLLIEEKIPIDKILVVTFTEAATAELRERIRKILVLALNAFQTGKSDILYIQALLARHCTDRGNIAKQIEHALCDFDQAAVFTIHGFCQRALKENAFESGILFDTELITDQTPLVEETIQDFWRKRFYKDDTVLLHFTLRHKQSPEAFAALTRSCLNQNPSRILSKVSGERAEKIGKKIVSHFDTMKKLWAKEKPDITSFFDDLSWAKKTLADTAEGHLANIGGCLEDEGLVSVEALESISALCSSKLQEATRSKMATPSHKFFSLCEELQELERDYIAALELECITFVQEQLRERKKKQNVQFFQDLLSNLRDGLRGRSGHALKRALSEKYHAALIDEFQDTDSLQYEIFQRVFATENNFLFLIGDPKQAIYGFRGADIFTYLKAAEAADRRYSLPTNFRSETNLVHAVNTLFQSGQNPFVFEGISFEPVQAEGKADAAPLLVNGQREPSLLFWLWDDPDAAANKTNAEALLPRKVAAEISRLLASDAQIGDRNLRPSDFAVLVLENEQARLLQGALREFNIPSVLHTNESLFKTREATEVFRLLVAVAEPGNERLLRAALATDLIGTSAEELDALTNNEQDWQSYLFKFREYHERWAKQGFIQMFRYFMLDRQVRQQLLGFPDGERRLTNVLHLSEVLHTAARERELGIPGLLNWLNDQIGAEGEAGEENQLRLESDENAVQLVTVHKSKGLEYPIVFCPFSWKPAKIRRSDSHLAWFHVGDEITLDLGSDELLAHQDQQVRENLAEKMRLLYVAVTRARNRCYVVWGKFREGENSALAYLLHQPITKTAELWKETADRFDTIGDDDFYGDLRKLVTRSADAQGRESISIDGLPGENAPRFTPTEVVEAPRVQNFSSHIENDWKVTSFSSLRTGASWEVVDIEALEERGQLPPSKPETPLFPSNIRAGICIHSIFQALDFAHPEDLETTVADKLKEAGFGEAYNEVVVDMARKAMTVSLPGLGSLQTIEQKDRLDEMEFYFPLNEVSPEKIDEFLRAHDVAGLLSDPRAAIGRLAFDPVKGFMKGYIDTVIRKDGRFYVVDWKTNWLGNSPEEYDDKGMREALLTHHYHLQYQVYTLAVNRYLRSRLPGYSYEEHFGGVLYLFLRGIDPERPHLGVFNDRPSRELIDAFDALLIPSTS